MALKRIIDEVPAHVVEPSILTGLPKLFASTKILEMPSDLIEAIGGESPETSKLRECLQSKMDVLSRSSLICRIYMDKAGESEHQSSSRTPEESSARVESRPPSAASEKLSTRHDPGQHDELAEDSWPEHSGLPTYGRAAAEDDLSFLGASSKKKKRSKIAGRWIHAE